MIAKYPTVQSAYQLLILYRYCIILAHLYISHTKVAVISPRVALLLDCVKAALRERLVRPNEIIGRLTCFMTMGHWLTFELHKNNRFYTKCFSEDTRQERGVRL